MFALKFRFFAKKILILLFAMVICPLLIVPSWAFTPGRDGNLTVTAANMVINPAITMSSDAAAGATRIRQTPNNNDTLGLTVGDLLLIYQATGATITDVNNYTYGTISNLQGAGNYEFVTVTSLPVFTGNQNLRRFIGISTACGGLKNSYTVSQGAVQIIRVPQYNNLTINAGASIVPTSAWNGTVGGVVAMHVNGTLSINSTGSITASGRGFRGGTVVTSSAPNGVTTYNSTANDDGAAKGESIAGIVAQRARGAAANGGGGGTSHNGAGGGGANGNNGNSWTIGSPAVNGGTRCDDKCFPIRVGA